MGPKIRGPDPDPRIGITLRFENGIVEFLE